MGSHASRVRKDIARWVEAGLIDAATGAVLGREVDANDRRSLSFGSILATMAALLFGAAIVIFVAANWEGFSRLLRVGMLFLAILSGYVGGAWLKTRDHSAIGEALWLVGAAAFGGSIALIGQMYHLTGDETQAILTWSAGTAVAAAALRSPPLTVAASGIAAAWMFLRGVEFWRADEFPYLFLPIALVLWLVSLWTRSTASRHLLLLALVFYAMLLALEHEVLGGAALLATASTALFAFSALLPDAAEKYGRLNRMLPVHGLLGFLTGMTMIQFEVADDPGAGFALAAALTLAAIVAALVLSGRESRGLRWIAYTGFAVELCLIYVLLVSDMLGTAGFFLAAACILGGLAIAIIRIERRMGHLSVVGAPT